MALTYATSAAGYAGMDPAFNTQMYVGTVTFDSSYLTGGEAFIPASLGFSNFYHVFPTARVSGYVAQWDPTNETILLYEAGADADALDEVASTTDVSTVVVDVLVFGLR